MPRAMLGMMLALLAGPAMAQDAVIAARAGAVVGERYDGYLGARTALSPGLRSQVAAINIKRRSIYGELAARRGVSSGDVGVATGCALLARVAVGEAYQLADEQWRLRSPGQAAPRPDYCG